MEKKASLKKQATSQVKLFDIDLTMDEARTILKLTKKISYTIRQNGLTNIK